VKRALTALVFLGLGIILVLGCKTTGAKDAAAAAEKADADVSGLEPSLALPNASPDSGAASVKGPPDPNWAFPEIKEKIWRLTAIRIGWGLIFLYRDEMQKTGLDGNYVIQFKDEGVNGKAVQNFYFAPYVKTPEDHSVSIKQIAATRDSGAINAIDSGGLGEDEYYWYLQRITSWKIQEGRLELHTAASDPPNDIVLSYIE
jgi:hypothetical protein